MPRPSSLDVLLTLVDEPADGTVVSDRLVAAGKRVRPDGLFAQLLALETSGHVLVHRDGGYAFSLTALGLEATAALAPGRAISATLAMLDLVGFVPYTVANGDGAAQRAADLLHTVTAAALGPCGGRVVKTLGDGVLAVAPADADVVGAVASIALRLAQPESGSWRLRAAVHIGSPIELRGDVYGHDVNLVSRLCSLAAPDELVCSAPGATKAERVAVRGLDEAVPIVRIPLVAST
jgi:class 3 adenylate cyclase